MDDQELDRLIERVHRCDPEIGMALIAAVAEFRRPMRVQITGREGTGRTTVATALGLPEIVETDSVDSPDFAEPELDGDVVVYVLAAGVTDADRDALRSVPAGHAMAVLNKADAVRGDWPSVLTAANEATKVLGVRTLPFVATLAVQATASGVTTTELGVLRALASADRPTLTLSPDLFVAADAPSDAGSRRALLERWELFGVTAALAALQRNPQLSGRAVTQILNAASGIDAVRTAMSTRLRRAASLRGGRFLDTVERLAARALGSGARDELEGFLRSAAAAQIGLEAAWASPSIEGVVADHALAVPADAAQALQLARWWRNYAGGDVGAPGRRAALAIHHGYVRAWSSLGQHG